MTAIAVIANTDIRDSCHKIGWWEDGFTQGNQTSEENSLAKMRSRLPALLQWTSRSRECPAQLRNSAEQDSLQPFNNMLTTSLSLYIDVWAQLVCLPPQLQPLQENRLH